MSRGRAGLEGSLYRGVGGVGARAGRIPAQKEAGDKEGVSSDALLVMITRDPPANRMTDRRRWRVVKN